MYMQFTKSKLKVDFKIELEKVIFQHFVNLFMLLNLEKRSVEISFRGTLYLYFSLKYKIKPTKIAVIPLNKVIGIDSI